MPVIRQIPQAHPDAIFSTIVGNTNISFFADLRKLASPRPGRRFPRRRSSSPSRICATCEGTLRRTCYSLYTRVGCDNACAGDGCVLSDYLSGRLAAWNQRKAGWGGPLFHGRRQPGPDDLVLMSNDYLALGGQWAVVSAQMAALLEHGNGLLMSGVLVAETDPIRALEQRMAAFLDAPAVLLCQSGWAANVGLIQSVAPPGGPVYVDAAAHASLWAGIQAAGAAAMPFAHNDCEHLERLIARHGPGLIAFDTLYSVTGDLCPLTDLVQVADRSGSALIADESHTLGVLGPDGAGLVAALGLTGRVAYRTASLAKAFAGRAGLIACAAPVADFLPFHSLGAIFSSTLLPHDIAGLAAALDLILAGDHLRERLSSNAAILRTGLTELGYNITPSESQIIPLRPGTENLLCRLQTALDAHGVFGAPFAYPAVGHTSTALRLSVHAELTDADLHRILGACAAVRDEAGVSEWKSTRRQLTAC
jgi:CAI-1 autoinducer synthase